MERNRTIRRSRIHRNYRPAQRLAKLAWLLQAVAAGAVLSLALRPLAALELPHQARYGYRIAWNGIPAAEATVEIHSDSFAGRAGYVFRGQAQTNRFVDLFWSYRAEARTIFLADPVIPISFTYERRTRGMEEITWIDYDSASKRAKGTHIKKGRRRDREVDANTHIDPIAAVFRAFDHDLKVGQQMDYQIFTGETRYRVALEVVGLEPIELPVGRFDAFKIKPEVWKIRDDETRDQRLKHAFIWVSRQTPRLLLRIRSSVFIGAVTLDLVESDSELPLHSAAAASERIDALGATR